MGPLFLLALHHRRCVDRLLVAKVTASSTQQHLQAASSVAPKFYLVQVEFMSEATAVREADERGERGRVTL